MCWNLVAILDAGRNAMSFFMLLVVSLGLSVVRESLGRTMMKCQALAGAHFMFGGMFYHMIACLSFLTPVFQCYMPLELLSSNWNQHQL
jgi:Lung seven transmembrane receptor